MLKSISAEVGDFRNPYESTENGEHFDILPENAEVSWDFQKTKVLTKGNNLVCQILSVEISEIKTVNGDIVIGVNTKTECLQTRF